MSLPPPEESEARSSALEQEQEEATSPGDEAEVAGEVAQTRTGRSRRRRGRRTTSDRADELVGDLEVAEVPSGDIHEEPSSDGADTVVAPREQAAPPHEVVTDTAPPVSTPASTVASTPSRGTQHHGRQAQPAQQRTHQGPRPAPSHQQYRQRQGALPAGVPSASAIDEQEPARPTAAPRQEPSGDLALLLRGFEEIQQKNTDRILGALRQGLVGGDGAGRPVNIQERVGVFVDVPNLVYAARYLNRWIDFGRLLDRLAAGRRIVRAQAYSPTDPDPAAEQQFLTPVKSQGFRLTTKNYRTFASGAKKADMDLDLCMDVVRMVVAKAVDCVIVCSGDGDFMPMVQFCTDNGVRVEVASFMEATSDELRQGCDRFYNLSAMDSIRLARPLANG